MRPPWGFITSAAGRDFVRAADTMIAADLRVNNEFYVAPCYNQLIAEGGRIVIAETGREYAGMYGLGIPDDLEFFLSTPYFKARAEEATGPEAGAAHPQ